MKSIFEYDDYKAYLGDLLQERGQEQKGYRSVFTSKIGIQASYLSQILHRSVHLNLEQAERASVAIGLSDIETNYFLLLVQVARAGTKSLEERLRKQIRTLQAERLILKNRVTDASELSAQDQMTYYSRWVYAAIHMAVAIPEIKSQSQISTYLGIEDSVTSDALDFLVKTGLVKEESDGFTVGTTRLFLGSDSAMIRQHHTNWRMQAIRSLEGRLENRLHFSTVVTLSRSDFDRIHENLIQSINEARAVIRESKEEDLAVLNVDFFRLGRSAAKG